jgi:hypothetical protein
MFFKKVFRGSLMAILGMWSIIALFLFSIAGLASKNIVILFWIFYFGQLSYRLFYRYLNNRSQVYTKHKYYHLVASIILLFLILFPIDFCVRGSHYYSVYICPIVYQYHTQIPEAKENLKGKQTNRDFVVYETYSHSVKAIYSIVFTYPIRNNTDNKILPQYLEELRKDLLKKNKI